MFVLIVPNLNLELLDLCIILRRCFNCRCYVAPNEVW